MCLLCTYYTYVYCEHVCVNNVRMYVYMCYFLTGANEFVKIDVTHKKIILNTIVMIVLHPEIEQRIPTNDRVYETYFFKYWKPNKKS